MSLLTFVFINQYVQVRIDSDECCDVVQLGLDFDRNVVLLQDQVIDIVEVGVIQPIYRMNYFFRNSLMYLMDTYFYDLD